MGQRRTLFKNTIALWIPDVLNPILSLGLVLAISAYLGVEGLGQYSLLISFSVMFTTVAALGLGSLVVREVSRRPSDVHLFFVNSVCYGIVSSLVAVLLMNTLVLILGYDKEIVRAAVICSASLPPATAMRYMESIFRAVEKNEYIAFCSVVENSLRVVVCVLLLFLGYGISIIFIGVLVTRLFGFALMVCCYVHAIGKPRWVFDSEIWRLLTQEAPTFAGIAIFSTIHLNLATVMLSKLQDIQAVGILGAAGRILSVCDTLPLAFSMAVQPVLTKKFSAGLLDLKESTFVSLKYVFIAVLPMTAGIGILGDNIIHLVYGEKFVAAGPLLSFLALTMIPFSTMLVLAQVLIATNYQRVDLGINMVACFCSAAFNIALVPFFAEMGTAMAIMVTILVFNQLQYMFIRKTLFSVPFWTIVRKPLLATIGMAICTFLLKNHNIFANIIVSALIYGGLILVLRVFGEKELLGLRRLLKMSPGTNNS